MQVRSATPDEAAAIAAIYNPYVVATCITFETEPVPTEQMHARIGEALDAGLPWLVATEAEAIRGYAYASRWKGRCAYRYSVETTVYLDRGHTGRGIGRTLYTPLLDRLRAAGMHAAIGGIALPNDASVALHERLGFANVARFREVGFKQDRWIDGGYWQLLLQGG